MQMDAQILRIQMCASDVRRSEALHWNRQRDRAVKGLRGIESKRATGPLGRQSEGETRPLPPTYGSVMGAASALSLPLVCKPRFGNGGILVKRMPFILFQLYFLML